MCFVNLNYPQFPILLLHLIKGNTKEFDFELVWNLIKILLLFASFAQLRQSSARIVVMMAIRFEQAQSFDNWLIQ